MQALGNVQQKIPCVFNTKVIEEKSTKRNYQPYKVVAAETLRDGALGADINLAHPTEKLDGTCVYIGDFDGKPWLWARHDKKPNKPADRRFKKFQPTRNAWHAGGKQGPEPQFHWKVESDFKDVPNHWIPAGGVEVKDGIPQPDNNGHIPGWIPVDSRSRQHCWHASTVDLDVGVALVLRPKPDDEEGRLELTLCPLNELMNCTMELLGTNINANPYGLGTKLQPFHALVRHGIIPFATKPPLDFGDLATWFENDLGGRVEGVVWHCHNGQLFKVHRHHLGLKWPVEKVALNAHPVVVDVDLTKFEMEDTETNAFVSLGRLNGTQFDSLAHINC